MLKKVKKVLIPVTVFSLLATPVYAQTFPGAPEDVAQSLKNSEVSYPPAPPTPSQTAKKLTDVFNKKVKYTGPGAGFSGGTSGGASYQFYGWETKSKVGVTQTEADLYILQTGTAKTYTNYLKSGGGEFEEVSVSKKGKFTVLNHTPSDTAYYSEGKPDPYTKTLLVVNKKVVVIVQSSKFSSKVKKAARVVAKTYPKIVDEQQQTDVQHAAAMLAWDLAGIVLIGEPKPISKDDLVKLAADMGSAATAMFFPTAKYVTVSYKGSGNCVSVSNTTYPSEQPVHLIFDMSRGYVTQVNYGLCP